ncbi:MAG: DUF4397 domain-containing protein [Chloroflexi bacterium]|nr:DUF4397 domain-containing protein [Chloroflexota bacterium]
MRNLLGIVAVLCITILAACQPAAPEALPTSEPSPLPSAVPDTATPAPTPRLRPTPRPTSVFGSNISAMTRTASLRMIHAAPDVGALDARLAGDSLLNGLGFGRASSITPVIPGTYTLEVRSRAQEADEPLASVDIEFLPGEIIDAVVVPDNAGGLHIEHFDVTQPRLAEDQASVRFVHAMSGIGDIQVRAGASSSVLELGGVSDGFAIPGQELIFTVINDAEEIFNDTLRVRPLTSTIAVVTGPRDRPLLYTFEAPVPGQFGLRVVNLSTEAREVDVYLTGELLTGGLAPNVTTDRVTYPSGQYRLSVYTAGADLGASTPYIASQPVTARPGSIVTLAVFGPVADMRWVWIEEDLSAVPPGKSRVVFVNAAPGSRAVRPGIGTSALEDVGAVPLGGVSNPTLLDTGSTRLFFRDDSIESDIVQLSEDVAIPSGQSIVFFVTGAEDGPVTLGEQVSVDETLSTETGRPIEADYLVRFVNIMVSQQGVDIFVEGEIALVDLDYRIGSEPVEIFGDTLGLSARLPAGGATLVDTRFSLGDPGEYTVVIFGTVENGINARIFEDGDLSFSSDDPRVRLINLTQSSTVLYGLGFAVKPPQIVGGPTATPTLEPTPTSEVPNEYEGGRARLPIGVFVSVVGVAEGKASIQTPTTTESIIYVIDQENGVLGIIDGAALEPGTHTDIFVFEYRTAATTEVQIAPVVRSTP